MRVDAFDFDLPNDRIAKRPAAPRHSARLLDLTSSTTPEDAFRDRAVSDLPNLLKPGDVMVFNDTRVIPARLAGIRLTSSPQSQGARIEITLNQEVEAETWSVFAKGAKKMTPGCSLAFFDRTGNIPTSPLAGCVLGKEQNGQVIIRFSHPTLSLTDALNLYGRIPLPPYMARDDDARDHQDYQTIYAQNDGAIAAPTAGLHFTPELLQCIDARGIRRVHVTLHVGAGTFLPVKVDDTRQHQMHAEVGHITHEAANTINEARAAGGRVICVGTTSLRLLESATREDGLVASWSGQTDIFITPGYQFRITDMLLTNFHLPRSTLFMLVSALAGLDTMKQAYAYALQNGYRFYSYGDACLLQRQISSGTDS